MPRHEDTPGSAANWLARARGDLAIARAPLPEGAFYEDLAFHAQQCAEKALKAVYQHNGWAFRYTHDLESLLSGLRAQGVGIPDDVVEADLLTRYASEARYPGLDEPMTEEEYEEAVNMAEGVLTWATSQVK